MTDDLIWRAPKTGDLILIKTINTSRLFYFVGVKVSPGDFLLVTDIIVARHLGLENQKKEMFLVTMTHEII